MPPLRRRPRAPAVLLLAVAAMVLFGFVMLFSTSLPHAERVYANPYHFVVHQGVWLVLGIFSCVAFARFDYRRFASPRIFWPLFLFTAFLLALCYAPVVGIKVNGAHRWIGVPHTPLRFQPSELAKLVFILFCARWFDAYKGVWPGYGKGLFLPAAILAVPLLLVAAEKDLGTATLLAATTGILFLLAGLPMILLALGAVAVAGGLAAVIRYDPERTGRVMAFLDLQKYEAGDAYQLLNALYAFVAGGFSGLGLGQGIQKQLYLPEAHTDFIFATIAEELGIAATLGIVLLFLVFLFAGFRIAARAPDPFGKLLAYGISVCISLQALMNVAVVTGSMPTKGIALPFISYGGSSLLVMLSMTGVLLSVARRTETVAAGVED